MEIEAWKESVFTQIVNIKRIKIKNKVLDNFFKLKNGVNKELKLGFTYS